MEGTPQEGQGETDKQQRAAQKWRGCIMVGYLYAEPGSIYITYVRMYFSHRVSVMPVPGRNRVAQVTQAADEPLASSTPVTGVSPARPTGLIVSMSSVCLFVGSSLPI